MNAHDIPDGLLEEAQAKADRVAVVELMWREFGAIMKIDSVLRRAIQAEEAAGIDVCAPMFEQMLWSLNSAVGAVTRELGRGA